MTRSGSSRGQASPRPPAEPDIRCGQHPPQIIEVPQQQGGLFTLGIKRGLGTGKPGGHISGIWPGSLARIIAVHLARPSTAHGFLWRSRLIQAGKLGRLYLPMSSIGFRGAYLSI
jgi:hypothetical protein